MSVNEIQTILTIIGAGFMGIFWWRVKSYIAKVDNLENRVVVIETVLSMLGDIKTEIADIKTDVGIIKSKIS